MHLPTKKSHQLMLSIAVAVALLVVARWFITLKRATNLSGSSVSIAPMTERAEFYGEGDAYLKGPAVGRPVVGMMPPIRTIAPTSQEDRLVVRETNLSLKVNSVSESIKSIESIASQAEGFLIDSHATLSEGVDSGSISIRVPSEKLSSVLDQLRGLAVTVVSENVQGTDLTDEFVDNEERLRILEVTKLKFETILADSKNVTETLNVQREILEIQSQIDSIKGQQTFLSQSSKLSRITVFVSTDELALPFAPEDPWRPAVVLKTAIRSLLLTLRQVISLAIWMIVYLPIIGIGCTILWIVYRMMKRT